MRNRAYRETSARPGAMALLAGACALVVMTAAAPGTGQTSDEAAPRIDCTSAAKDPAAIRGTARAERIIGTPGDDIIVAGGGNDRISGLGGNDIIIAGAGNDIVRGNAGDDTLCGGLGRDRLVGNQGADRMAGGPGRDTITSGPGGRVTKGTPGPATAARAARIPGVGGDVIRGDGGDDDIVLDSYLRSRVDGGPGNDTIAVRATISGPRSVANSPLVNGGGGADVMSSGASTRGIYRFFGGSGNDEISGGRGLDVIDLGPGDDVGRGFAGNDRITGAAGNDRIFGQAGFDTVDGGPGRDFCRTSERVSSCEI